MTINHIFFVDDSIIFHEATKERAENIHRLISEYAKASGQLVNYDKFLFYLGANVVEEDRTIVSGILGALVSLNPANIFACL